MNLDPNRRRIQDEIAHHLAELESQLESEGLSRDDARAEAARRFGDPGQVARETPATESAPPAWRSIFDSVRMDFGHALRQMIRHPLLSGLTLATLIVGVAATAIVFSVVHTVVLSPLAFENPDEVVHVSQTSPQGRRYSTSEPNFVDFQRRQRSFTAMAAMAWQNPILSGLDEPQSVEGRRVSHTFFPLLGIPMVAGRGFEPDEDIFGGASDVVLISEGTWTRRFGADEDVVGRILVLDGVGRRVVGVVASDRAWPGVEVFTPLAPNPDLYRDDQRLETVARLRPGVSVADARTDMEDIAAQLSEEYPESNDRWGASVRPVREWLIGARLTGLGTLLLGSVALFLLMACASVSNLLLARASVRIKEMGVRSALGAGRARIAAQLVAEGVLLAVLGGAGASALSFQGLRLVQAFGPGDIARLGDASIDGPVLLVALAAATLTVIAAGIAPALLLMKDEVFSVLRVGSRSTTAFGSRLRDGLVVAQFALAVTVVLGAALLTRSFVQLQDVDLGFEVGGMVRFAVRLPDAQFSQVGREDYLGLLKDEIEGMPGMLAVGSTTAPPFSAMRPSNFVARSDQEPDRQQDFQPVSWRAVSGDFFAAAGISLLSGRVFGRLDGTDRAGDVQNPPVIIDRRLADLLWPGEEPVGRLLTWFLPGGRQCEVVGVVTSARDERIDVESRPRIYRPFSYTAWDQPTVLVRVAGDPAAAIPSIRRAALAVDADVPAISPTVVAQDVRNTIAWPRFSMQVLAVFGLIALTLASMGIYGVTSFSVAQRRHEIGVRMALGAEPAGLHWMVAGRALRLAALGIGGGLAASLLLTGVLGTVLSDLLYGVSRRDPVTFLTVPVVLSFVALVSAWIPARRAVGLDPKEALVAE
jgi:putative ABC transport system permease protein